MTTTNAPIIPEYGRQGSRVSPFRGAMIQTGAVFVDAYRELNHRKMFWIVLVLSVLVVAAFAAVSIDDKGVTLFGKYILPGLTTAVMSRAEFYKLMYNNFAVQWWLGWAASILALISTAGIFPDLLTGGSVDLYLSKPISRLRLFLTKYAAALLFVALQVTVFSATSFLVIGIRGGVWLWGLFLAVPLVVCIYSYLYSICTLLGVMTRSTLAALLLTILAWLCISMVSGADSVLLTLKLDRQSEIADADHRIETMERRVKQLEAAANAPATNPSTAPSANAKPAVAAATTDTSHQNDGFFTQWARKLMEKEEQAQMDAPKEALVKLNAQLKTARSERAELTNPFEFWYRLTYGVKTVLPKTSETLLILNRGLEYYANLPTQTAASDDSISSAPTSSPARDGRRARRNHDHEEMLEAQVMKEKLKRPVSWVLGTSLCFEAVLLSLAALIFVRRDY